MCRKERARIVDTEMNRREFRLNLTAFCSAPAPLRRSHTPTAARQRAAALVPAPRALLRKRRAKLHERSSQPRASQPVCHSRGPSASGCRCRERSALSRSASPSGFAPAMAAYPPPPEPRRPGRKYLWPARISARLIGPKRVGASPLVVAGVGGGLAEMVILWGLARRVARQTQEASLLY